MGVAALFFFLLARPGWGAAPHPVLAAGAYELHRGFELSLFASEPDVVDPVALTFDEGGRMFVVEMRDYPSGAGPDGKPGGTVRLLEDTDGDGRADRSILFATGLSFPTSIAPWKGGMIVAAPPEILYLKDTDGDGRADVREVLFSGFVRGVTDSNVNGLRWGLDNRLHGLNGGNDGMIVSRRQPGPAMSIRGLDFSFDPESGDFTPTVQTSGGFGLAFDEWGRSFVTYNINHIQQRMIPDRYLRRFPGLPPFEGVSSISDHGEMARIYPVSEPETRPNHPEQSGRFSAAGGVGFAGLPGLPGDVSGSVLVCDVVGNLVHRDVLEWDGPIFRARRSATEETNEFFAGRDRALRPVGFELGPDDAFYLIDMQRDVIEHPDYIPQQIKAGMNLRAGEDRGRIYRLVPKRAERRAGARAKPESTAGWVARLSDQSQWWRQTAQRVLVENHRTEAIPALQAQANPRNPLGRLHALWTLAGLKAIDESLVIGALQDSSPGLRENALLLAEPFLARSQSLRSMVPLAANDSSPRVRFQAALTLGQIDSNEARDALRNLWRRDGQYRWTRRAALSSLRHGEDEWLRGCLGDGDFVGVPEPFRLEAVRELAELSGSRAARSNTMGAILSGVASARVASPWQLAVLDGLSEGVPRGERVPVDGGISNAVDALLRNPSPAVVTAVWRLANRLGLPEGEVQRSALARARERAVNPMLSLGERVGMVQLLAMGTYPAVGETLLGLLNGVEPGEVQSAAVAALREFSDPRLAVRLVEQWRRLNPAMRSPVLAILLQRVSFHEALVAGLESGRLTLGELNLDLEQRRRLLWRSSKEVMARAARFIGDGEYSNRRGVVAEWLGKLPAAGEAPRGRAVFGRLCAPCHALGATGASVGPDLSSVAHRSVEDLVSNILDPNMAINPGFVTYVVETTDGELQTGVLLRETPEAVVLGQAEGRRVVIPRKDLKELRSTGQSLMPEGLESGMTPGDLRDLVAYLQQVR